MSAKLSKGTIERHDFGLRPAACGVILHCEHIIGEEFAEAEFGKIGLLLSGFHGCDFHIGLLAWRTRTARRRGNIFVWNILPPRAKRGKHFFALARTFRFCAIRRRKRVITSRKSQIRHKYTIRISIMRISRQKTPHSRAKLPKSPVSHIHYKRKQKIK